MVVKGGTILHLVQPHQADPLKVSEFFRDSSPINAEDFVHIDQGLDFALSVADFFLLSPVQPRGRS